MTQECWPMNSNVHWTGVFLQSLCLWWVAVPSQRSWNEVPKFAMNKPENPSSSKGKLSHKCDESYCIENRSFRLCPPLNYSIIKLQLLANCILLPRSDRKGTKGTVTLSVEPPCFIYPQIPFYLKTEAKSSFPNCVASSFYNLHNMQCPREQVWAYIL
jgi:hypothetical protein